MCGRVSIQKNYYYKQDKALVHFSTLRRAHCPSRLDPDDEKRTLDASYFSIRFWSPKTFYLCGFQSIENPFNDASFTNESISGQLNFNALFLSFNFFM